MNTDASSTYLYDGAFFRYIRDGSARSAQKVVPFVAHALGVKSVLDVGCGAGTWLSEYGNQAITDYLGIDGGYVKKESLLVAAEHFRAQDITQAFDLGRRFDLVQCLEVGEHIPRSASETLVENLVRHSSVVLFSAAIPGQGGENHINEQPYEFWRALFRKHEYQPFDFVRSAIKGCRQVESWYRHNIILYAASEMVEALPPAVARTLIPDNEPIANVSNWCYQLRTRILALLPADWLSKLAQLNRSYVVLFRRVLR